MIEQATTGEVIPFPGGPGVFPGITVDELAAPHAECDHFERAREQARTLVGMWSVRSNLQTAGTIPALLAERLGCELRHA
jgi:hypothetical protein